MPVYSDADGLYAITQPVSLNAAGQATVYADAPYYIEIQDSTGASVRSSDRGNTVTASQVEIENTAATGTSLTNGSQVAGGRTDLNTFLTNLRTSFGAADGNVLVGATSRLLRDALLSVADVFNVKATTYGASGDGSSDDTAAIQRAITACETAGGGVVFFPPGTYKVTSTLTTSIHITLLGSGWTTTKIQQTSASAFVLTATALVDANGIWFESAGRLVSGTGGTFTSCRLRSTGTPAGAVIVTTGRMEFEAGRIDHTTSFWAQPLMTGPVTVRGGSISFENDPNQGGVVGGSSVVVLTGVVITNATAAGCLADPTFTGTCLVTGCSFSGVALKATVSGGSGKMREAGSAGLSTGSSFEVSQWRDSAYLRTSTAAVSYAPNSAAAKFHEVVSSGATFEWGAPTNAPITATVAHELVLRYKNTSGGAITPTMVAIYHGTAVSVASGSACGWHFVYDASLARWVQIGDVVAYVS